MKKPVSSEIADLGNYSFIQYIQRRRSYFLTKLITEFGILFVPVNDSINFTFHYLDIKKHIFRKVDRIHFENKYKRTITVIGNEIRTENGYAELRLLNVIKVLSLSAEDAKELLSLRFSTTELRVYIISGPLNRGLIIPISEEQISDVQATRILQFLSTTKGLAPLFDSLKEVIDTNDNIFALYQPSTNSTSSPEQQKRFEQLLRSKGREIVFQCKKEAQVICSKYSCLACKQNVICYSLHHFCMQLLSPYLIPSIMAYCQYDLNGFEQSWKAAQNLSLEDLHVSAHFHFNYAEALKQFNNSYFVLQNHADTVLPFTILEIWDRLLSDIRYIVNTEITKQNTFTSEQMKTIAVSTDDLIGIVIHIFLHTDLALVIPAHLILVDAFCPFDLSITASGYSYSVIETAVLWINEYAKVHAPL